MIGCRFCRRASVTNTLVIAARIPISTLPHIRPIASPVRSRPIKQGVSLRPERRLLLERLVRDELTLHRHLAAGRRAASARMSAIRRAPRSAALPATAVAAPLLVTEAA
jgi:hypothetical protein